MPNRSKNNPGAGLASQKKKPVSRASFPPFFQFVLFGLLLSGIMFGVFRTFYSIEYSATGIYLDFASKVFSGQMPYRDFSLEYPPLALVFFLLPRLFSPQWAVFSILYQVEVLIFALVGLWLMYKIALRMGKAPWKLMAPYILAVLVIGPILGQQYDIFPAVMTLLSLYCFWLGRHKSAWLWLALGIMTKLYPAIFIPLYLIIYWRNRQLKPAISGLISLAVACLVMLVPFLVTGPQNLLSLIDYHSQRGIQVESSYSAFLLLADKLNWVSVKLGFDHGSWNLSGPLPDVLSRLTTYIQLAALLACYSFIWTQVKKGKSQFTRLGAYSLLLISVLLFTSKIFSPQYIIWLLPAIPLIFTRWRIAVWTTFAVTGVFTFLIFPVAYLNLLGQNTSVIVLLFVRDLTLAVLAVLAVISLKGMKSSE